MKDADKSTNGDSQNTRPLTKAERLAVIKYQVERYMAESLPMIAEAMVARALAGDNKAAIYLMDRMLGKPPVIHYARIEAGYDEEEYDEDEYDGEYLIEPTIISDIKSLGPGE